MIDLTGYLNRMFTPKIIPKLLRPIGAIFIALSIALFIVMTPRSGIAMTYPITQTVDQVDVYHGVTIADPYRWLEDLDSSETKAWVESQNKVTFGYLQAIPKRDTLQARLTELWNYENFFGI